jgi:hypothetical protein
MAFQAAPSTTANNANQNSAQPWSGATPLPVIFTGVLWQAAPLPTSVNSQTLGAPIGG